MAQQGQNIQPNTDGGWHTRGPSNQLGYSTRREASNGVPFQNGLNPAAGGVNMGDGHYNAGMGMGMGMGMSGGMGVGELGIGIVGVRNTGTCTPYRQPSPAQSYNIRGARTRHNQENRHLPLPTPTIRLPQDQLPFNHFRDLNGFPQNPLPPMATIQEGAAPLGLADQLNLLDGRLSVLEQDHHESLRGAPSARGRAKQVARSFRRKARGQPYYEPASRAHGQGVGADDEDLGKPTGLSRGARAARVALARITTTTFREMCGVGKSEDWPTEPGERRNEITNELYLSPDFEHDVTSSRNRKIITTVAARVMSNLENIDERPAQLRIDSIVWSMATVESLAKSSFRYFKACFRQQSCAEKEYQHQLHARSVRHRQRRIEKASRLLSVVPAYIEKHGADPSDLIAQEHMSDEASGPEFDDDEEFNSWKLRMAASKNMREADISEVTFWEVVKPVWRSDRLSSVFHELQALHWAKLTSKQRARFSALRVRDSGRLSTVVPDRAPYDFGICKAWFDTFTSNPHNVKLVEDWYTYGDIDGFGGGQELVEGSSNIEGGDLGIIEGST
ncbi:hypothetical protein ONZ45_g6262 [Pleurotus djamor]|nr:hypothetical protein ONZ45_g6262 [Pleurotus djamor]